MYRLRVGHVTPTFAAGGGGGAGLGPRTRRERLGRLRMSELVAVDADPAGSH